MKKALFVALVIVVIGAAFVIRGQTSAAADLFRYARAASSINSLSPGMAPGPPAAAHAAMARGAEAVGAASRQQTVTIDNFSFNAKSLTVAAGTEVTWINRDDAPHKVVSTDNKFASPVLDTDGRYSYTFTTPGTYEYYCSLHPMMTAKVVVK